jgi:hypothetical protein
MKFCHLLLLVSVMAALPACPNNDSLAPREACEDTASAICERIYACLSPQELANGGFPSSEAACVVKIEDNEGCRAQTLDNVCDDGNASYHPSRAATCIEQIEGMSCAQLRSGDIDRAAPSCDQVCAID